MIKCPNCNEETISRWRGMATCPNCLAVVKESYFYRLICIPIPMTCAAISMNTWFPDIGFYTFTTMITITTLSGLALTYAFPIFKVARASPE